MHPHLKNRKSERGQAVLLVVVAMGIVLLGALGFAIDGSQLFAQRRMAQAAADAAAEAGIISMLNGADGSAAANYYAQLNGFGGGSDRVLISSDATSMTVTVQRPVPTTLMKFLGASTSTISATATAAITTNHPHAPQVIVTDNVSGAFTLTFDTMLTITGGANRVIQVNSGNSDAVRAAAGATVDLTRAGEAATGADFGVSGGPALVDLPLTVNAGAGKYVQRASGVSVDLSGVTLPATPAPDPSPPSPDNCPPSVGPGPSCVIYSPGLYTSINIANQVAVFEPGIYDLRGGTFGVGPNGTVVMGPDPTNIGILLLANSVQLSGTPINSYVSLAGSIITGTLSVSGNVSISFPNTSPSPAYSVKQVALCDNACPASP